MGRLTGKTALITGGNSGIGAAVARLFVAEGAQIMLAVRTPTKARTLLNELRATGGVVKTVRCDVQIPEDCENAVDKAIKGLGHIDILFNNAGVVPLGTVIETSLDDWRQVLMTNVSGTFMMCKAALPHMIECGKGNIINNASDWAVVGGQRAAAYAASKGAVALLTKSMALDHARQGIRVNAICPGDTYVERWDVRRPPGMRWDQWRATLGANFPLGRVGEVEEIARAVLFLASDESSYMTGQLLVVDGGNTAGGTGTSYD
ncbi:MAG: SDR family oxidoreductase [Anaerolineae bacterium]